MKNLSFDDYSAVRAQMVDCVLNTDMAGHFGNVGELKSKTDSESGNKQNFELFIGIDTGGKDKNFVMKTLVHTADICNPAKPTEYAKKWTFKILDEFFI
jgi:hypothetical protein